MKISFDSNYQRRFMKVQLLEPIIFNDDGQIKELRRQWLDALKGWHAPYKAVIDLSLWDCQDPPLELKASFQRCFQVLHGLFLKSEAGFHPTDHEKLSSLLPFTVFKTEQEALDHLQIKIKKADTQPSTFRQTILVENHFRQQVIEVSFLEPSVMTDVEVLVLKQKLFQNLNQWHSGWSLLVNCENLDMTEGSYQAWYSLETFLSGFFMRKVVGYGKKNSLFPFRVVRVRHLAAMELDYDGQGSGEDSNCQTKKTSINSLT